VQGRLPKGKKINEEKIQVHAWKLDEKKEAVSRKGHPYSMRWRAKTALGGGTERIREKKQGGIGKASGGLVTRFDLS